MDFEETLLKFGFHPATGRTPKGVQVLAAEPNPFLTYTVQAFDDGSALFTWEFVQHEAIHHGQWSIYASLAGFDTPLSWRTSWGM